MSYTSTTQESPENIHHFGWRFGLHPRGGFLGHMCSSCSGTTHVSARKRPEAVSLSNNQTKGPPKIKIDNLTKLFVTARTILQKSQWPTNAANNHIYVDPRVASLASLSTIKSIGVSLFFLALSIYHLFTINTVGEANCVCVHLQLQLYMHELSLFQCL